MTDALVIAVDFDGTLCESAWPDIGKPNWAVINKLKTLAMEQNVRLLLWTCRTGESLKEALAACADWGLSFSAINDNDPTRVRIYGTSPRKVGVDFYLDDRALPIDRFLSEDFI